MRKLCLALAIFFLGMQGADAQAEKLSDPEAYFAALIVRDMDESVRWYTTHLGMEVLRQAAYPDRGFKQANLQRGNILIEFIELDNALSAELVVPNFDSKTRMVGLFKIGFLLDDFDRWIDYLTNQEIDFYGSVVKQPESNKRMVIVKDPDGNRIQLFEK